MHEKQGRVVEKSCNDRYTEVDSMREGPDISKRQGIDMKVAFYDDDPGQRKIIRDLLLSFAFEKDIEMPIIEFESAEGLISQPLEADILLLDIKLEQEKNGIAIARKLRQRGFHGILILITAASEYALEGYQVETFRYLMKPLKKEVFFGALTDALGKLQFDNLKVSFFCKGIRHYLRVDDILMVESYYHICRIHTQGQVLETTESLRSIWDRLPKNHFACPHRSFLVNLAHVTSSSAKQLTLTGEIKLTITRTCQNDFLIALHNFIIQRGG